MKKLSGIIPPVITPILGNGELDKKSLNSLINYMINGGVHGLFLLGTTGEGPALGRKIQMEVIEESAKIIKERVPFVVGISSTALADSLEMAEFSKTLGAMGVVATPPCYFLPGEPEIYEYYKILAEKSPLPIYIYNMPAMTKVALKPKMIIELAKLPNIAGYKDSSGNMCDLHEILLALRDNEDFSVLVGPEELLAEAVLFGASGGVSGGANINPKLFCDMYQAAKENDMKKILTLQEDIYQQRKLYSLGNYQSSIIKGIKCASKLLKVCETSEVMLPFEKFEPTEEKKVQDILDSIKIY